MMLFKVVAKTRREFCALVVPGFLALLTLFGTPLSAQAAQSVTLAWDPSPGSDIAGYNIYYGVASSSYTNRVPVGNVTNATVAGLTEGATYYFTATAMNTSGLESDFSNEVAYTVPTGGTPGNQPPTLYITTPSLTINENASEQTVALSGIGSGATNEAQALTVTASSSNPALIPNPAVSYSSPNTTGTIRFAPVMYGNGSATITVQVNDGQPSNNIVTRTLAVTVLPVNQQPTLNAISAVSFNENATEQTVALSGISSGATNEAQTLTIMASSSNTGLIPHPTVTYTSPNATGTLRFTPVMYANGTATITVQVNDGQPSNNIVTRTFAVTVAPVNQQPTLSAISAVSINENATEQTVALSGISSGATNEAQTLTVTASSSNTGLIPHPSVTYTSPNTTGTIRFAPVMYGNGSATITVQVNDGQPSNNIVTRTFAVTVAPVNQSPTLNTISAVSINQNAGEQTVALSGISSGATNETQTLAIMASSSNTGLIPHPTVTYTSPNATGTLKFAPVTGAYGSATITVEVNDGQASNNTVTRSFAVTVVPVNQPPTIDPIADVVLPVTAVSQTVNLAGITAGATNEAQTLAVTASSSNPALIPAPAVSYTSPSRTGSLTLTPMNKTAGTATITVTVADGQAVNGTTSRSFLVSVVDGNQAPTLDPLPDLVLPKNPPVQRVTLAGISSGAPFETQPLSVTAVSSDTTLIPNPTVSYLSPGSTGTISFRPTPSRTGTANITVTVNDGQASNNIVRRMFAVTVAEAVAPQITQAPTNQVVAGPGAFTLHAAATGTSPLYQWYKDGTALAGATGLSLTVAESCRADAGEYSLTVSNSAGSVTSPSATVRVLMPQRLSLPQPQPDGSVLLSSRDCDGGTLASGDAANFELQVSADLVNWVPVGGSAITVDNGALAIWDTGAAGVAPRYYRVVERP